MRIRTLAVSAAALSMLVVTPVTAENNSPIASGVGAVESAVAARGGRGAAGQLEQQSASETGKIHRKIELAAGPGVSTYLVRFADSAVPSYRGGKAGLPATAVDSGQRLDTSTTRVRSYEQFLVAEQDEFIGRVESKIGREPNVRFTYQYAVNGMAIDLSAEEVLAIANDPNVVSITPNFVREMQSDAGPSWIEADQLWQGLVPGLPAQYQGEGIVIGTIDSGISPVNDSFKATGDDGFTITNPRGQYYGACDPTNVEHYDATFAPYCNDKLIGAYVFDDLNESAIDDDGHGSHTASTSGGSYVDDVVVATASGYVTPPFDISGVAPHANIISYLGCCSGDGLTAAIEQAIIDEVDVINYSIGSSAPSQLWDDFDALGFLEARAAGIFVATSNGNDGPNDATTGSPADAPWITSVGATTHNRHNGNVLTGLTSSAGPLPDIDGKAVTGGLLAAASIVNAGSPAINDPFCIDTTGNTEFVGAIVVCARGTNGRVEKSANVAAQGAVGFILINDELNGDSLLGDEYAVPGLFISFDDGEVLRDWLATGTGHEGTIQGTQFTLEDARADILTSFSSRGPNRAVDLIVPSVSAPGADILAAVTDLADPTGGNVHGFISGTSMASPHVAGAGALIVQVRPDWSPAEIQSALMTTAVTSVLNHDGGAATPYQQGSGRIDVARAVNAGLLFDETIANYEGANPAEGGDPKTLNVPSFANSQCLVECSWVRTATVPTSAPAGIEWTVGVDSDTGLTLDVLLSDATPSPATNITVTADVAGAPEGATLFGRITLTPDDPSVPTLTMPVAVVPSSGVLPDAVNIETRRDAGSQVVEGIESVELTDFQGTLFGWTEGTQVSDAITQDSTNGDPYDNLDEVFVQLVEVDADSLLFIAEIIAAQMPDADLYVGTGTTPSAATEQCFSASGTALEYCAVDNPVTGPWWILVQNWNDPAVPSDPAQSFTMSYAAVPNAASSNGSIVGPIGTVATADPYDISLTWDLTDAEDGDIFYGVGEIGTEAATPDNIGSFPARLVRVADDVTKSASVATASATDDVDYTITVESNVTPADLEYTIVDTVPAGMTIDAASVTGGGVVSGQTITWTVPMPTAFGADGNYVMSTPGINPNCVTEAVDLVVDLGLAVDGDLDGDTASGTYFAGSGPFNYFGVDTPSFVLSEDGLATAAGGFGGSPWIPQALPDPDAPNGVLAPLWADFEASVANDRGVVAASIPQTVALVQWEHPVPWGEDPTDLSNSAGRFQLGIYPTVDPDYPEIYFEYLEAPSADIAGGATIGLENLAGSLGVSLLDAGNPVGVIEDGDVFCWDYVVPEFPPTVLEYSVSVDSPAVPSIVTNEAEHITDDPFAEQAVATADVEVLAPLAAFDPASVNFGDVDADDSATVTVTVKNDGTADLAISGATAAAPFSVDTSNCDTNPVVPDATCDIDVTFAPSGGGPASGSLTVISNANASPHTIALSGNGFVPDAISPIVPGRYWDSRDELTVDGLFRNTGRLTGGTSFEVQITGRGGIPAGAKAVIANLAAISPSSLGFATMYPCTDEVPIASHVNYFASDVVANSSIVPLDEDGALCVFTLANSDFALDISGFLGADSPLVGIAPARYLETRSVPGFDTFDGVSEGTGRVLAGQTIEVPIAGRGSVPDGAAGALVNVTAVNPDADGFLTVFPCGTRPDTSTVNYFAGQFVPNGAVAELSDDGGVCIYSLATTDILLDVSGYVPAGAAGIAMMTPKRLLDTRPGESTVDGDEAGGGRVPADGFIEVQVTGRANIPADATAAILNVGVVYPDGPGFVTLYPCGDIPVASNVNHTTGGVVRANNSITKLSAEGSVCIYTLSGTDLILDVAGWIE